jgi:hypothetical protein
VQDPADLDLGILGVLLVLDRQPRTSR